MPNKYRALLADAIERNGGYSRGYHDRWAISYNVALDHTNLDQDHVYKLMCEAHGPEPMHPGLNWNPEQQWEWAQEAVCLGLDTDTNRSYSPGTAKRYGLPEGEKYFDVTFGLYGRSGKHLCVEQFEGHKLDVPAKDLAADIRGDASDGWANTGTEYSNEWCRNLLAMMDEWESMFTSKNASAELEYQAAFQMHSELYDLNRETKERTFWEERDVATVGAYA